MLSIYTRIIIYNNVDEIIEALEHNSWQNKDWINHYKEVKQEINK